MEIEPSPSKAEPSSRDPPSETSSPLPTKANTPESGAHKKRRILAPTVQEIIGDALTSLSLDYWASEASNRPYDPRIIEDIYFKELKPKQFELQRIMLLEVSHYLENYLWPNFDQKKSTFAHIMSLIIMINEKFREGVKAWDTFLGSSEKFPAFFERVLKLQTEKLSPTEKCFFISFWINIFQSLEEPMVRKECSKLVSLQLWAELSPEKLESELKNSAKLRKLWQETQTKLDNSPRGTLERKFLPSLIEEFLSVIEGVKDETSVDP